MSSAASQCQCWTVKHCLVTHYNKVITFSGTTSVRHLKFSNYITVTNPSNADLSWHVGAEFLMVSICGQTDLVWDTGVGGSLHQKGRNATLDSGWSLHFVWSWLGAHEWTCTCGTRF